MLKQGKAMKTGVILLVAVMMLAVLAACGATAEVIEVPVEKIVEKEVIRQVEVIKEVPIEKIVEKEVIKEVEVIREVVVEKEVIKEVMVEPTPRPKDTLVFAGLDWTSVQVQNGVARYIIENGYGYPTDAIDGSTVPLFQGLINHDIDITMEIWLPNQVEIWSKALKQGEVIAAGKSLEDNWQSSFVVPTYLVEQNPGLVSVSDIPEFKDLWVEPDSGGKAVLIGCLSGWSCRKVNEEQIAAYGLEDVIELRDPGTQAGLFASLQGAYLKGDPWLGYLWGPTKPSNELDLTLLEEPAAEGCANPGDGCAFPPAEVLIAVNTDLIAEAPEVIAFLRNWDWNGVNQLFAEAWYSENKDDFDNPFEATGIYFLKNNETWTEWVPDDVEANVRTALGAVASP